MASRFVFCTAKLVLIRDSLLTGYPKVRPRPVSSVELGSDVPTPAPHRGRAYVVSYGKSSKGTITCVNLANGTTEWELKLPKSRGGYSSSPLIAGNHLYVTQENGTTFVLGPLNAGEPSIISTNVIADNEPFTVASPIPYQESLLLRSRHKLYRIVNGFSKVIQ